jgi:hypothetical protein
MAPDFYVGDEHIPVYGGFKGGIYFKVHDPRFFERNVNKPIRFTIDGTSFYDTGVTLPQAEASGLPDAIEGNVRSALPTKAQVLRQ